MLLQSNTKPQRYNLYNLEHEFQKYLLAENDNLATLKNYLSDYRHFWGFMISQRGNLPLNGSQTDVIDDKTYTCSLLTSNLFNEYKNYLINAQIPEGTINRRLSTTRKFIKFCIDNGYLQDNPQLSFTNIGTKKEEPVISNDIAAVIKQFEASLIARKYSQNKVRNIVGTINQLYSAKL